MTDRIKTLQRACMWLAQTARRIIMTWHCGRRPVDTHLFCFSAVITSLSLQTGQTELMGSLITCYGS